jgi:hypothetical protein
MRKLFIGIAIGVVLGGAGVALASIPDASGVIHACRNTKDGSLRVIDSDAGQTCGKDEVALAWNQTGPQGPAGPQGPQGPAGANGVSGLYIVEKTFHVAPGATVIAYVYCPAGKMAIAGGWVSGIPGMEIVANNAAATEDNPPPAWQVAFHNTTDQDDNPNAYANCVDIK